MLLMISPDSLNAVTEFHRTFHAPVLDKPQIPSAARCGLRVALLSEELDELRVAIADNNMVEIADVFAIYNTFYRVPCLNLASALRSKRSSMKCNART